jgi:hypothetical protein
MAKRDYSDTGQRSQSDELFEDIFQLALTKEQRKKKGAKPVVQTGKKSRAAPNASPAQTRKVSPAPPLVRSEANPREQKAEKRKVAPKRPRSGRRTRILIVLLLLAVAGAAATFLLPRLNMPELFQRTPVKSAIKKEMPPKPSHKPSVREPEKPSSQVPAQVPRPLPAPPEGGADETEKQPGFSPSTQVTKNMLAPPPSPAKAKSFPYSIYLGSFKKEEALQNAVRIFREKGLSPFLVRMDLGEKGVWLRVFSGHFENQEQAEAWIKKNQIADAETKNTRYAILLGEYSSKQEAEARVRALENSGCHPYVIGVNQASLRIYSGAYYRMEDAEKELAWLAPKGVKGRIVER